MELVRSGGYFQIVRNKDMGQVIAPDQGDAPASAVGVGPMHAYECRGHCWCLDGKPGDTYEIAFKRTMTEADVMAVSWNKKSSRRLTEDELTIAGRPRYTILGTWNSMMLGTIMDMSEQDGKPVYTAYVKLGQDAEERFYLAVDGDTDSLIAPLEGMWTIGSEDDAKAGEVFCVMVQIASHGFGGQVAQSLRAGAGQSDERRLRHRSAMREQR